MFLYEQGYEIDGSDSGYCLVDHQTENLLEVVKYLLSLKIVNRKKEIKIRYTEGWNYNRKEWKEETFKWEEIKNAELFQIHFYIYKTTIQIHKLYENNYLDKFINGNFNIITTTREVKVL